MPWRGLQAGGAVERRRHMPSSGPGRERRGEAPRSSKNESRLPRRFIVDFSLLIDGTRHPAESQGECTVNRIVAAVATIPHASKAWHPAILILHGLLFCFYGCQGPHTGKTLTLPQAHTVPSPIWRAPLDSAEQSHVASVAFLPDGVRIALGMNNGPVLIWRIGDSAPETRYTDSERCIESMAVSPDGRLLVTAETPPGTVSRPNGPLIIRTRDLTSGKIEATLNEGGDGLMHGVSPQRKPCGGFTCWGERFFLF